MSLVLVAMTIGCGPNQETIVDFKAQPLVPAGDVTFSASYRGKPALIYVWATWCGPCRQIAPYIKDLKQRYSKKGIEFVAVALDNPKAVRQYELVNPHGMDVYIDPEGSIGKTLNVEAIPTIAVLDKDHRITLELHGLTKDTLSELESALKNVEVN